MILRPMRMTKGQKRIYDAVVALTLHDHFVVFCAVIPKVGGDNGYVVNHDRVQSTLSTLEKAMMRLDEKRQVAYYGGQD